MAKRAKSKRSRRKTEENPPDALGYRRLPDGPKRKPILPIGEILPAILTKYGVGRRLAIRRFAESWTTILGEIFPASSETPFPPESTPRVSGFRGGTVTVEVRDAALFQELTFYTADAVRRFQELLPDEKIRAVKFVLK